MSIVVYCILFLIGWLIVSVAICWIFIGFDEHFATEYRRDHMEIQILVENFYKAPNHEDFVRVWRLRNEFLAERKICAKFWFVCANRAFPEIAQGSATILNSFARDVQRVIDSDPTVRSVDAILYGYYGSGSEESVALLRTIAERNDMAGQRAAGIIRAIDEARGVPQEPIKIEEDLPIIQQN